MPDIFGQVFRVLLDFDNGEGGWGGSGGRAGLIICSLLIAIIDDFDG